MFNLVFGLLCCSLVSVLIGIFRFLADYKNFYPKEKKEVPKGNDKKHESKGKRRIFCAHPIFFFFSELGSFHGKLLEYGGDYWCNE